MFSSIAAAGVNIALGVGVDVGGVQAGAGLDQGGRAGAQVLWMESNEDRGGRGLYSLDHNVWTKGP